MTAVSVVCVFLILMALWYTGRGTFIHPTAYTLTAVTSMNGSPMNGSCPQECVGGDVCDCTNTTLNITGVLIDGVVPTIDITQRRTTWARQLLTVRINKYDYAIGFRFGSRIILRAVELYVFHCPSWNIGTDTINIYNTLTFPRFIKQFNSAGNVTLTSDMENCESLTRVSIPLQTAMNTSNYFIEFTNSNGMQVQQLYIGEVRFSDQLIPNQEEINTTTTYTMETTAASYASPLPPTVTITPTIVTQTSNNAFTTSQIPATPNGLQTTVTTNMNTAINTTSNKSPFPTVIVGAVVGVILGLLLLICFVVTIGCLIKQKKKFRTEVEELQNMVLNRADVKMDEIDSPVNTTSHNNYSGIDSSIPDTRMLNDSTETGMKLEESNKEALGQDSNEVKNKIEDEEQVHNEFSYSIITCKDIEEVSLTAASITDANSLQERSEPDEETSLHENELCAYAVVNKSAKTVKEKGTYSLGNQDGDSRDHGNSIDEKLTVTAPQASCEEQEDDYDTIYREPIEPSLFTNLVKESNDTATDKAKENGSEESVYASIYDVPAISASNSVKLLEVKPENIHKIKTLGTGNFGKVILADTVGLSMKDLKMSDMDDDKTKSIRVAVKQLKKSASTSGREAFDKELKFMSRLNHPNVIRILGACTLNDPFIMIEYMEKGDLNEYLLNFDTISPGNCPPDGFTINTGTLTNMSAQIATAMAYLSSHNFIHRDLATRNCLVGSNLQIKVADFGMSRSLYKSHYYVIQGYAVLPVRWMARECFYGKFSAKTDVWAFGVTMWEIFTLAKDIPYEDMDEKEIVVDATKKDGNRKLLEQPKKCPQEVYEVMLKCWSKNPKLRATFKELHTALLSLLL